jgi:hypothetical protein
MSDDGTGNTDFADSLGEFSGNELFEGVESTEGLAQKFVDLNTQHSELQGSQPVVPEEYTIDVPEGVAIDEVGMGAFKETAKELGMTQAQYEKVVQFDIARTERFRDAANKKAEEATAQLKTEMGDKFEGNLEKAQRVLKKAGGEELAERVDLANDPELFKFLHNIGEMISEDSLEKGGKGAKTDPRPKGEDGKNVLKFKDM